MCCSPMCSDETSKPSLSNFSPRLVQDLPDRMSQDLFNLFQQLRDLKRNYRYWDLMEVYILRNGPVFSPSLPEDWQLCLLGHKSN